MLPLRPEIVSRVCLDPSFHLEEGKRPKDVNFKLLRCLDGLELMSIQTVTLRAFFVLPFCWAGFHVCARKIVMAKQIGIYLSMNKDYFYTRSILLHNMPS